MRRYFFTDQTGYCFAAGQVFRKNQVAHEQAAAGQVIGADLQIANLALHFFKRILKPCKVITDSGIFTAGAVGPILGVGHVDIDEAFKQAERLNRFITAAVVDYRQTQPSFGSPIYSRGEMIEVGSRADQVDIAAALALEAQHESGQLFKGNVLSGFNTAADCPVLTEDTLEVAVDEKDRSGASASDQFPFLTEVRSAAADDKICGCPALSHLSCRAVNPAAARAKGTAAHDFQQTGDSLLSLCRRHFKIARYIAGMRIFLITHLTADPGEGFQCPVPA